MEDVKISVLIPVFNAEKYIQRCIESILRQNFVIFEVIVVNDGSTDSTERILKDIINKDNRIKYIWTENRGVSAARQTALEHAQGKYIIFIDSDDWIESNMLSEMYQKCIEKDVDGVCAGIVKDTAKKSSVSLPSRKPIIVDSLLLLELFYKRIFVATLTCYMFKRCLWEGFVFPANISVGEDMAGVIYVLKRSNRIFVMNKAYYHYCQNKESIVHSDLTLGKINAYYYEKNVRKEVLKLIPHCREEVDTWYIQNKIYLLSAMGRSRDLKEQIAIEITNDFRHCVLKYFRSKYLTLPYKISLMIIAISGKFYYWLYCQLFHHAQHIYKWVSKNE